MQPAQNKIGILLPNGEEPVYRSAFANGNAPVPVVLNFTDFATGTLADKPAINRGHATENYIALATVNGKRVLRQNMDNENATPDPITGKLRSGWHMHSYLCGNYHSGAANTAITVDMKFFLDHCQWNNSLKMGAPFISGKLFMCDTTEDSLSWYLGLTDKGVLTVVPGNDGVGGKTFSLTGAGGWCNRSYGWRDANGQPAVQMYLQNYGAGLFRSDGRERTMRIEIRYNPGNVGYHLCRISIGGVVFKDAINAPNGWFTLPIEFKFKGPRWYVGNVDINNPLDFTTHPHLFSGYAAGLNIVSYRTIEGYLEHV